MAEGIYRRYNPTGGQWRQWPGVMTGGDGRGNILESNVLIPGGQAHCDSYTNTNYAIITEYKFN